MNISIKEINMKKNVGLADRIFRLVVAAVIAALYFTNQITGTAAIILGVLALILLLTSLVSFCPLYAPFKLSTAKKSN
jgi:glucose uptake protein GlcU